MDIIKDGYWCAMLRYYKKEGFGLRAYQGQVNSSHSFARGETWSIGGIGHEDAAIRMDVIEDVWITTLPCCVVVLVRSAVGFRVNSLSIFCFIYFFLTNKSFLNTHDSNYPEQSDDARVTHHQKKNVQVSRR